LPQGCSTRELDLLGRALTACGAMLARAARVTVSAGQLTGDVPEARAYLVFGEAQAHALGRALPAAALHRAQIVLADEPATVLTSAAAKRRLWNALRNVRRALATADH
jgi:ABC-type lipoprotein export system ATPase subunit